MRQEIPHLVHEIDAQRVIVHVDRLGLGEHVVERATPFRLQSFSNRGAAASELGVAQLGVMQLVAVALRPATRTTRRRLWIAFRASSDS